MKGENTIHFGLGSLDKTDIVNRKNQFEGVTRPHWKSMEPRRPQVAMDSSFISSDHQGCTGLDSCTPFHFREVIYNFRIRSLAQNHKSFTTFREYKRIKLRSFKGSCWLQSTNRSATMETMPGNVKVQFSPAIMDNSKVHLY